MIPTSDEKWFGHEFLDQIVNWISDKLEPEEVFSREKLKEWTQYNLQPEEVYNEEELSEWADNNDFIRIDLVQVKE